MSLNLSFSCFLTAQGSNATGDCCSKCWSAIKPKDDDAAKSETDNSEKSTSHPTEPTEKSPTDSTAASSSIEGETKATTSLLGKEGENIPAVATDAAATDADADAPSAPSPAKKKKKKATYKSMMADMLEGGKPHDVEKEKEKLKQVTGGGAFTKIDKI